MNRDTTFMDTIRKTDIHRNIIMLLMLCFAAAVLFTSAPAEAHAEDTGCEQAGLLVMGDDVNGTEGFLKDIICLTRNEVEEMKEARNPGIYGLGDCWKDNVRFSSYDNHGAGGFHYSIADGLDVEMLLDHVKTGGYTNNDSYWIYAADSYCNLMVGIPELKYYAPGDTEGIPSPHPLIAYYKTTTVSDDQSSGVLPEGPAQNLGEGEATYLFGQNAVRDDNNCHFIQHTNTLISGNKVPQLRSDSRKETTSILKLNHLITQGLYKRDFTVRNGDTESVYRCWGVPLDKVLEQMGLDDYMPGYADVKVQFVASDKETTEYAEKDDISGCFISWGFYDGMETPENQKGAFAAFIHSQESDRVLWDLYKINITDKNGNVITSVPAEPVPDSVSGLKAELTGYRSAEVSWKVVNVPGYECNYRIEYKKASAGSFRLLKANMTGTKSRKTGLDAGTSYIFRVTAYVKAGNSEYTGPSRTVSVITLKKMPVLKANRLSKKYIKLKWNKLKGASGYQIAVSKYKSKAFRVIRTTGNTSLKIKALKGKRKFYRIRAYRLSSGKKIIAPWSAARSFK